MVQGKEGYGKTGWYDIGGKAINKYVKEQGDFLLKKIKSMIEKDPKIIDKNESDTIYIISPFKNVAYELGRKLGEIGFTRKEKNKVTNIGTIHSRVKKHLLFLWYSVRTQTAKERQLGR